MRAVLIPTLAALALGACASDDADADADAGVDVVVSHGILGDIVAEVAGAAADVEVVMPDGAAPHEFAPSARQVEAMAEADLLVVNGAGFEPGLGRAVDRARDAGVEVFTVTDHLDVLTVEGGGDPDPHVWMDPERMATAVEALGERLAELVDDPDAQRARARAYAEELRALAAELDGVLAAVPPERRVLVTNHEVLGYFADRFGFEVVGAVVPSLTTGAQASAGEIEELAALIEREAVPAIFAETTSSSRLAEALADRVGDVAVVELHTESLGEPGSGADTYVGLLRTDAQLIADALR